MPHTVQWNVPKMFLHCVTAAVEPNATPTRKNPSKTQPQQPGNRSCPSSVPGTGPFLEEFSTTRVAHLDFPGQQKQHGHVAGCQKTHHPSQKITFKKQKRFMILNDLCKREKREKCGKTNRGKPFFGEFQFRVIFAKFL